MSKFFHTRWLSEDWHVPDDDLLPFLDGELPARESTNVRNHLEACWNCRQKMERVQKTISGFVEYYNSAYVAGVEPAPGAWRTFDSKLKSAVAEADRQSMIRGWLLPQITPVGLRAPMRLAVGLLAGVLVVLGALVLHRTQQVSASQLIQKAAEARRLQISAVAHPVVYQRLRVEAGSRPAESLTWEIWHDEESGHTNQRVEDSAGPRSISPEWDAAADHRDAVRKARNLRTPTRSTSGESADRSIPPILRELHQVFQANHMDWRRPLALASYASWVRSRGRVSEEVQEKLLPSGERAYVLIAAAVGPFAVNDVARTEVTIRLRDWHPLSQRLEFQLGNRLESLDLAELAFKVSSPVAPAPAIIADTRPLAPPPQTPPIVETLPAAPTEIELLEAEVQAHYALHRMGACTGEPVEVRRDLSGGVVVEGLVETPERKKQLEEMLRLIPLVTVKIQSSEDLGSPNKASGDSPLEAEDLEGPPQPVTEATQKIPARRSPIEDQLRAYFTHLAAREPGHSRVDSEAPAVDEEITALSNEAVSLSEAALMEAWALRRLAEAYSRVNTDQLSPRGKRLLEIMLTEHLAALKLHTDHSRALLKSVLLSVEGQAHRAEERTNEKRAHTFEVSDSNWSGAVLRLWAAAQHIEKLTAYFFAGASWPGAKDISALGFWDDLDGIDVESRQAEARVAEGFSGHFDLSGSRESDGSRIPQ